MNPLLRFARLLIVLALSVGPPQSYLRADEAVALTTAPCVDQAFLCAKLQQAGVRLAVVGARESTQFALKSPRRSSPWHAAVLLAAVPRPNTESSLVLASDGRVALAAAGLSSTPVRAPPASA